jgi:cytochrome b pre-mRNA-processing protein 3
MKFARWNPFDRWRARRERKARVEDIHGEIVAAARAPELYAAFFAPDDLDGRFEMVVLHAGLVLRRLSEFGEAGRPLAQDVVDRLFVGFDDALRELSISDDGVAKRVKKFAEAYFGRSAVYQAALDAGSSRGLAEALARNVYRGQVTADALGPRLLAERVLALSRAFEGIELATFVEGRFRYPLGQGGAK